MNINLNSTINFLKKFLFIVILFVAAIFVIEEGFYWLVSKDLSLIKNPTEKRHQAIQEFFQPNSGLKRDSSKSHTINDSSLVDDKNNQKENPNYDDNSVINTTQNILSKASLIVAIFSIVVVVFAVILAIFGLKWFEEVSSLRREINLVKRSPLDSAKLVFASLPELTQIQTQQVPECFSELLSQIHTLISDNSLSKVVLEKDYKELMYADALYHIANFEFDKARQRLENLENKTSAKDKLIDEIRDRLGIIYRKNKLYIESYKKFSELKHQRENFNSFGQAVTMYACYQKGYNSINWKDYEKIDEIDFLQFIIDKLIKSANDNINISTMQFLVAEFMGFILDTKKSRIVQLNNVIHNWSEEEWKTELNKFIERAIELSEIQLPLQKENNIRANWHYALALLYYYLLISIPSQEIVNLRENIDQEFNENIRNSKIFAERAKYVFSEKLQIDVSVSDFIIEIKELNKKFLNKMEEMNHEKPN